MSILYLMEDYKKQLELLGRNIESGLSWPEGAPLEFAAKTPALETPFVGSRYQHDSLMILLGDAMQSTPATLIPSGLSALESEESAPLDFLLIAALASVFLSRYGADVADRLQQQELLESSKASQIERARLAQALEPIACGQISQQPVTVGGKSLDDETSAEFHDQWLQSVLSQQLSIINPFYVLVIGDQKEAWEIVSQALGCVAWSRETDQTAIGHLIALKDRELQHEVMFIKDVPTTSEHLNVTIEEFRRFIDGGFLLGHEEFDLMQKL